LKTKQISLLLGIMCFLLTVGIYVQIKTVNNSGTAVAKTNTENELRNKVLEMKEKYEKVYSKVENKEKELTTLINDASANDSTASELSERLNNINSLIGLSNLQGPGIIIHVSDSEDVDSINISDFVVHDWDLIMLVNDLCIAGAEAISINGERIVSTSAITCIGNVIKINDEKVGTPFEIKAIGSQERLYGALTMNGRYLEQLKARGLNVKVIRSDSVEVDKYNGIFKFDYAH